jgi:hypothetical protein
LLHIIQRGFNSKLSSRIKTSWSDEHENGYCHDDVLSRIHFLDSDESKLASFKLGMKEIYGHENFQFVAKISLSDLNKAFESARDLIPLGKQKVFQAFKMAINYDQSHHLNEAIFLKIISQIMGIPL